MNPQIIQQVMNFLASKAAPLLQRAQPTAQRVIPQVLQKAQQMKQIAYKPEAIQEALSLVKRGGSNAMKATDWLGEDLPLARKAMDMTEFTPNLTKYIDNESQARRILMEMAPSYIKNNQIGKLGQYNVIDLLNQKLMQTIPQIKL
jgi:hypothetical protein